MICKLQYIAGPQISCEDEGDSNCTWTFVISMAALLGVFGVSPAAIIVAVMDAVDV